MGATLPKTGRRLLLIVSTIFLGSTHAFVTPSFLVRGESTLLLLADDASRVEPYDDDDGMRQSSIVTKEMLLRDMLAADLEKSVRPGDDNDDEKVIVKKKRSKGGKSKTTQKEYKIMDNRDILPFQVRSQTPDPYTNRQTKRERAAKTRKNHAAVEEQLMMVQSTLYNTKKMKGDESDGDDKSLLGEFQLHKDTTTGDTLLIGNAEYKVTRHRCQYKYAGGKRFVMVRKILEVKEVGRMVSESYLKRQWNKASPADVETDPDQ